MELKRSNRIILLGVLFQISGLVLLGLTFMALNSGERDWSQYLLASLAISFILSGILLFSMKKISIILSGSTVAIAAFYQAYLFYDTGEFSLINAGLFVLLAKTVLDVDRRVFEKESNNELVKDGAVLSQKSKFYVAVAFCLVSYSVVGWYSWPQNNGRSFISDFVASSANRQIDCHWAGYFVSRKTGHKTVHTACSPRRAFPTKINTKEELSDAIVKYVVSPGIESLPTDSDISTVVIVQVSEDVVSCSEVTQGKVKDTWYDSYENYCVL